MKLRYGRKERDSLDKRPKEKPKLKNLSRKIRNTAFAVALPLIAAVSAGCEPDYFKNMDSNTNPDTRIEDTRTDTRVEDTQTDTIVEDTRTEDVISDLPPDTSIVDPCRNYNETTIAINRSTDGDIPSYDLLETEPADVTITEYLIDFVNETHALATSGMPYDVRLTIAPDGCRPDVSAYAVNSVGYDRGVYLRDPATLFYVNVIFHEIGHLQPGGGSHEVISQLNEIEQDLMAFAVFSIVSPSLDMYKWASEYRFRMPPIKTAVHNVYSDFSPDEMTSYPKALIFIFNNLIKSDGSFSYVRDEYVGLVGIGNEPALTNNAIEFAERFSPSIYSEFEHALMDAAVIIRSLYYKEIYRRFGEEVADDYFNANSGFPYRIYQPLAYPSYRYVNKVRVYSLDDLNCYTDYDPEYVRDESCSICAVENANHIDHLNGTFCCFSVDGLNIQKWAVEANLMRYYNSDGSLVRIDGLEYDAVDFATINSQEARAFDEPCF